MIVTAGTRMIGICGIPCTVPTRITGIALPQILGTITEVTPIGTKTITTQTEMIIMTAITATDQTIAIHGMTQAQAETGN